MLDTLIEIEYEALMLVEQSNEMTTKQFNKVAKKMKKKMKKEEKKVKAIQKNINNFCNQIAKIWG
jgi:seryl-tRNA synthetase